MREVGVEVRCLTGAGSLAGARAVKGARPVAGAGARAWAAHGTVREGMGQGATVPPTADIQSGGVKNIFELFPVKVVGVCEACAADGAVGEAVL